MNRVASEFRLNIKCLPFFFHIQALRGLDGLGVSLVVLQVPDTLKVEFASRREFFSNYQKTEKKSWQPDNCNLLCGRA